MRPFKVLLGFFGAFALMPAAAWAAGAPGSSQVTIVAPNSIIAQDYLRFGEFMKPASLSLLYVGSDSTVTTFGGLTAAMVSIPQSAPGRGPGSFLVKGNPGQLFTTALPGNVTINGAGGVSMTIFLLSDNTGGNPTALNAAGQFTVKVGGYLLVNGGQAAGRYQGSYNITVTYQ